MGGCIPGFIEGYKDDPNAVRPETNLHSPTFLTATKRSNDGALEDNKKRV